MLLVLQGGHLAAVLVFFSFPLTPSPSLGLEGGGILLLVVGVDGGLLLHAPGPVQGDAHALD